MADEHHEDFLGKSNQALVYEYASKQMPEVFADARSDVDVVVVYRVTPLIDSRLRGQFPNVKLRFVSAPYSLRMLRDACDEVMRLHRRHAPEIADLTGCEPQDEGRGILIHTTDLPRTRQALAEGVIAVPVEMTGGPKVLPLPVPLDMGRGDVGSSRPETRP